MARSKTERKNPRLRSKLRTRKRLAGSDARPRISVFRSSKHTYAQIVSDQNGKTIVSASTLDKEVQGLLSSDDKQSAKSVFAATVVGKVLAKRAKEKNISAVCFDRNGFVYHGRIKAVADGAREEGLRF